MELLLVIVMVGAACMWIGGGLGLSKWESIPRSHQILAWYLLASGAAETVSVGLFFAGRSNIVAGNLWELSIGTLLLPAVAHLVPDIWARAVRLSAVLAVVVWVFWFGLIFGLDGLFRGYHLWVAGLCLLVGSRIRPEHGDLRLALMLGFIGDMLVYIPQETWLDVCPDWVWQGRALVWLVAYFLMTRSMIRMTSEEPRHGQL